MLTKEKIFRIAMEQSAKDISSVAEDFMRCENVFVESKPNKYARKYLELPFSLQMVSYGNNIVASASKDFLKVAEEYLGKVDVQHAFETPGIHLLSEALRPLGHKICFMAEYFLPDPERLKPLDCKYQIRELKSKDFKDLYTEEWSNALCKKRSHLDVLGMGAYDSDKLVGLAACSADCDTMWQIGIDVLPNYRRMGVASSLTSRLAIRILEKGRVPFYCAAWCNIKSVRNAVKSGFSPAWAELTAKPDDFVNKMITK